MPKPLFIAFEGGEGSGKSSQVELLTRSLQERGHDVLATYEPGATSVGQAIRTLLLETDEAITPRSEALLFAADRAHHVESELRPALAAGRHVVCDRYLDSSIAYQGAGRILPAADIAELSVWATGGLLPDLTVLLDIDPEVGLARVHGRRGPEGFDRLEREDGDFHRRVREGFRRLALANPDRYLVLDAQQEQATLAGKVLAEVLRRLEG